MKQTIPFRILSLGDSYTVGTGIDNHRSWPVQLVEALRAQGVNAAEPMIIAKNGWQTGDLLTAVQRMDFDQGFDLVTLLIGVNDQYDGVRRAVYKPELRKLIEFAIELVNGDPTRVLLFSIPDWSVTPFAWSRNRHQISLEIDLFNTISLNESRKFGVNYIDVTILSRTFGDDPQFLAPDGLHPSGKMYSTWVEIILPVIQKNNFVGTPG